MELQDFTTFDITDPSGRLSVEPHKITVVSDAEDTAWVSKDLLDSTAVRHWLTAHVVLADIDLQDMTADGVIHWGARYGEGSSPEAKVYPHYVWASGKLYLFIYPGSDWYEIANEATFYLTMTKLSESSVLTCDIYDDEQRENLLATIEGTCPPTIDTLFALWLPQFPAGEISQIGAYTENLYILAPPWEDKPYPYCTYVSHLNKEWHWPDPDPPDPPWPEPPEPPWEEVNGGGGAGGGGFLLTSRATF